MKRRWVFIEDIDPWDYMHFQSDNEYGFDVSEKDDGKSLRQHIEEIDYIAGVLTKGQKIMPILITELPGGKYKKLDGFKRLMAHKKAGNGLIECFICTPEELEGCASYEYMGMPMECRLGGQNKGDFRFPLFEGGELPNEPTIQEIKTLYFGTSIRIELCENFHIHWGELGKYRLELGRRDFLELADAFEEANIYG
jgi:hypothetical protein